MHLRGRSPYRLGLLVVIGQLAVRALVGGGMLVLAPSGALVGLSTDALTGTPFSDFLVPGLVLLVVLGVYPAFVCYGLYTGQRWGWVGAVSVAIALSVWVAVELVVGFDRPTKYLNLLTAGVILVLAVHPSIRLADGQTRG